MATYACPELLMPAMPDMVKELPCAEMDKANPVHCALFQSGDEVALDRVAAELAVTPPTTASITLMFTSMPPLYRAGPRPHILEIPGSDPPYLSTRRLRI